MAEKRPLCQYSGTIEELRSGDKIASVLTTKGDLLTRSTEDVRLSVGSDGQILMADSTQASGLKWGDASGSASTLDEIYVRFVGSTF